MNTFELPQSHEKDIELIRTSLEKVLSFLVDSVPEKDLPNTDGIFIFGHIDPRIAEHAAHLWNLGKSKEIIISGKGRTKIPHGFETEADFYASILKSKGVTDESLILEKEATNSLENITLGIDKSREEGLDPKSLIICAVPALLRRSKATFSKQFPDINIYGSAFDLNTEEYMTLPRIKRLMGEFDRFKEYHEKGDMEKIDIPEDVESAIKEIKSFLEE